VPVLIVGASSDVGRELAASLVAEGAQVRAYVFEDDPRLRAAGVHVAVGELDDLGKMESAMEQVHTVVHLPVEPDPPRGRTLAWVVEELTDIAVRAAFSADVVRFLAVSFVGDPSSDFIMSRVRADEIVAGSRMQQAVLRCAPILGPTTALGRMLRAAAGARLPVSLAPGTQRLNPVWAGDVARALLLLDDRDADVSGTYELGGPDAVTFDDLVERVAKRRVVHRRNLPDVPRDLARSWMNDCLTDSEELTSAFRMERTGLAVALQRSV
jgi:NADH dehydrogenase